MLGGVKLIKNVDFGKYIYSGCGIGFDAHGSFLLFDGSGFGKNVIIFGANMASSGHVDSRKKDIIMLGKDPTQGLGNTTLAAEK